MLFTNLRSLLAISVRSILIGYDWVSPTVFLQAPPNLLLLINRSNDLGFVGPLTEDEYPPKAANMHPEL